eukprot:489993_1
MAAEFKKYCIKCDRARLPSSSNAKFDFDYCAGCKKISTFAVNSSLRLIGIDIIKKKILIVKDTRNLNKICYLSFLYANLIVFGYIKNVYIQTPMEIQDLIMLFYDNVNDLSKTNNIVNG